MRKIYLAGGFYGHWQEFVIDKLGKYFTIYNPKQHRLENPKEYTNWDLFHIQNCDILLGYMTECNPSGYGLALEIGFAKGHNKLVILVDEKSKSDSSFKSYFAICHESADLVFPSLEDAVLFLETFAV